MGAPSETGQANSPGKWEMAQGDWLSYRDINVRRARAGGQTSGSGTNCGATCVASTADVGRN